MELTEFRRSRLALALALAMTLPVSTVAVAQDVDDEDEEEQAEDTRLDAITVTGSRIKRSEIEGPAPVTVITAAQMEREGFTTVYEALNTLTQTAGNVQNELFQSGFTPNASVLNLRGLGPGRTLVLINGRRAADYPLPYNGQSNFVNLASIPSAAVERIEVLAGGASAIYGSDAVAGVINIVLKTDFDGDVLSFRAGYPTEGGAATYDLQWVGGKTGSNWNVTYAIEAYRQGAIYASEREFMDSYRDDPSVRPQDATAVQGIRLRDRLVGTGPGSQLFPDGEDLDSVCARFSEFEIDTRSNGRWCGYYGYPATQAIRNENESLSGYLYGTLDFDNGMQAFVQTSAWTSDDAYESPTQFYSVPLFYDPNFDSILDGQRIFTPAEAGADGQQTTNNERSIEFAAGVNGTLFDNRFDWEAVVSTSRYDVEVERPRFLAAQLREFFLGEQLPGVDPFFDFYPIYELNIDRYFNPITPEQFRAMSTIVETNADSSNTTANFVLSGDLFELPAGPVGFASIIEWGTQEYELIADPRIAPGQNIIYNLTGTGGGGERDRYAFGVEFSVPVLDSLTATAAGRYDKYDDITDVDDAITYNLGLEWRPLESLLVRGAYATSFRAPDLHFVFADESGFFSGIFDEFACRDAGLTVEECGNTNTTYNYTAFGVRSGNPGLEEEEGESFTVGFVWDIVDDLSLSVDYYDIELEGIVGDLSSSYILRNEAACLIGTDRDGTPVDQNSEFCQFILDSVDRIEQGPDEGRISEVRRGPINRAYLTTSGIDANLRYRFETEREGNFYFELAYSHTLESEFREFIDSEPFDRDDLQNFDWRSRMRGSVTWEYGDFTTTLFGTRYGSLPNWAETGRIAPYHVYNFAVKYDVTDDLAVSFIANNVLNKFAPKDDTFFTYPFFWRGYSPIGRELFVQIDYRFN